MRLIAPAVAALLRGRAVVAQAVGLDDEPSSKGFGVQEVMLVRFVDCRYELAIGQAR